MKLVKQEVNRQDAKNAKEDVGFLPLSDLGVLGALAVFYFLVLVAAWC
jgi:hypothetical protein